MKSIWAHTIVRNEEKYIWFAVMSVVDYVDKILIWDTGSSDKTFEIAKVIKKIYPKKVELKEVGNVDINEFTKVRQEMLKQTKSDWLMILDGDEVWWENSIKRTVFEIKDRKNDLETIVNPYFNLVGDMFHYQENKAGNYIIDGKKGHLNIRFINRKIPGLHLEKPHGTQGFYDSKGILIQNRNNKKKVFIEKPYLHFTNMVRSSSLTSDLEVPKRKVKFKYEIGKSFPLDFYFPEVFFRAKPDIVPSPWSAMDKRFYSRALLETPLRKIKRRMFKGKVGY